MRHISIVVCFILCLFVSCQASARLKDADLNKPAVVTEEAALLSQVDAVSLYLSSDRVAYAPKLMPDKVIEVEVTVLGRELRDDRSRLQDFITRQIRTFISVLRDRLPIYAPAVARSFNSDTDIAFRIDEGPDRSPLASYSAGRWQWAGSAKDAGVATARSLDSTKAVAYKSFPPPPPQKTQASTPTLAADQYETLDRESPKKGCDCPSLKK